MQYIFAVIFRTPNSYICAEEEKNKDMINIRYEILFGKYAAKHVIETIDLIRGFFFFIPGVRLDSDPIFFTAETALLKNQPNHLP